MPAVEFAVLAGEVAIVREPVCLPADTSVRHAIERLRSLPAAIEAESRPRTPYGAGRRHQLHRAQRSQCVIVTEADRAIGIVTAPQLLDAVAIVDSTDPLKAPDSPASPTLGAICTREISTYDIDRVADLADLRHIFQELPPCGFAVANDGDRPIGLISETSLLYAIQTLDSIQGGASIEALASGAEAWQASEVRYRALLEDSRDAVIVTDIGGDPIEANHMATKLFGYSRDALLSRSYVELFPAEDRPAVLARLVTASGASDRCSTIENQRIISCDGRVKYVDIDETIATIEGTTLVQTRFQDVTQRNWQENTLRHVLQATASTLGRDFFDALVAAIADALGVDYVFLVETVGETASVLASWSCGELQPPQTHPSEPNSPCGRVLREGCAVYERGVASRFPDFAMATELELEGYVGVAFYDNRGDVIGYLCVCACCPIDNPQQVLSLLNIFAARAVAELERQHAQEILKQLNQQLELLVAERTAELRERELFLQTVLDLDSFPFAMFWKDRDLMYLGCNRKFAEHAGLVSIDDIVGKTDDELPWNAAETETHQTEDRQVLASGCAKLGIVESRVRADGDRIWLETSRIPLRDVSGDTIGVLGLYQDITARKRDEEERQQLVERLDLALKSAAIGVWEWDIANNQILWDARMYAMYGLPEEELSAARAYEHWQERLHPADREMAHAHARRFLQSKTGDYSLTFQIVRADDGSTRTLHSRAIVKRDDRGVPLRMNGINFDITERVETERLLKRQLATIEAAAEGIAILDNKVLTYVNPTFAKIFGHHNASHLVGQTLDALHPPETIAFLDETLDVTLHATGTWKGETIARRRDGAIFSEELSLTLTEDGSVICVCSDISDRKQAEADLKESEARWKFALEGAGDGVWDWNVRADLVFFSSQWKATLGYSDAEIGDRPHEWDCRVHPDDLERFQTRISAHLRGETPAYTNEYRIRCKDGSYKWVLDRGQAIERDAAGRPLRTIGLQSDISARKAAEQQLRDAKETAEMADRAKSNFLALMSHELRTPLNGVLGLASLLFQTTLDAQQQNYLANLHDSAASLSQIVNDILDFSGMQADTLQLETTNFTLRDIVARLKTLLTPEASEKGLDLHFEIDDEIPQLLSGDPLRLGQVLFNLSSNAIKFTDSGSVTIAIVPTELDPDGDYLDSDPKNTPSKKTSKKNNKAPDRIRLKFSIHDTGIGMSDRQIDSLFEPFTQADPSPRRRYGGTGLGLTICQRLVESMGGDIAVRSTIGQGSAFEFELTFACHDAADSGELPISPAVPIAPERPTPTPPPHCRNNPPPLLALLPDGESAPAIAGAHGLSGVSVLLVEDNEINQLIAKQVLQQCGMNVTIAENGHKAIAQVVNTRYDIILMDVQMPELDGLEATRRIRRLAQLGTETTEYLDRVPILAMTAHAFAADRERSLEAGMNDHLTKPIDTKSLTATIARWLDLDGDGDRPIAPTAAAPADTPATTPKADPRRRWNARSQQSRETSASGASPAVSPVASPVASPIASPRPDRPVSPSVSDDLAPPFGLDVDRGLARINGDTELYVELLEMFADIYTSFGETLSAVIERGDRGEVVHLLHTLKGSAGNVAADGLSLCAARIVDRLRLEAETDPLVIEEGELSSLLRHLDRTLDSIARHLPDARDSTAS